ncbi:MAG: fused MFS/spermidine synthase, partial [Cyanobacteria bacterium]|nr:fused MFS/spermidine synthase [Cyanobacteriota bacterium]
RLPEKFVDILFRITPPSVLITVSTMIADTVSQGSTGESSIVTDGLSVHLLSLLIISTAFHGKIALERPGATKLTGFYLAVALGGVLGSGFNILLAPIMFRDSLDYPVVLCIAGLVALKIPTSRRTDSVSFSIARMTVLPLAVFVVCLLAVMVRYTFIDRAELVDNKIIGIGADLFWGFLIPFLVCLKLARSDSEIRLGAGAIACFWLWTYSMGDPDVVYKSRNFYGCLKVTNDRTRNKCTFWHGSTIHGVESVEPALRGTPQSYYIPGSPIGEVMQCVFGRSKDGQPGSKEPIAVVGLGCGTLASYSKATQTMIFYEIDQDVISVANNRLYFTYLSRARKYGVDVRIENVDGRIGIKKAPYEFFRLIVMDAFSSDSIPTHLVTLEALDAFKEKLKKDGAIAFNVTNNYLDLKPLLAEMAESRAMQALWKYSNPTNGFVSAWVVLTENSVLTTQLLHLGFKKLDAKANVRVWTDDYSAPLSLLSRRIF